MGAPVKKRLSKQQLEKVADMAARGVTRTCIARSLGWSTPTFYRRLETDEALKEALETGKAADFQEMMHALRKKALEGSFPHMAGYLRVIHQTNISENGGNVGTSGAKIVVQINMAGEAGQIIEHTGEQIEHDSDD